MQIFINEFPCELYPKLGQIFTIEKILPQEVKQILSKEFSVYANNKDLTEVLKTRLGIPIVATQQPTTQHSYVIATIDPDKIHWFRIWDATTPLSELGYF